MMDLAMERMMKYPEAQRVEHTGLGLYGLTSPPGVVATVFDRVVAFFAQLGCTPTHLASNVVTKSKWVSFSRGFKRWRADSSEGKNFSLISFPAEERAPLSSIDGQPAQKAAASWGESDIVVTFCPSRVGDHTPELLDLAREIASNSPIP